MSSVFPDRLIHPLPKRRLRERLSPDVADSIQYPPAHASGTPLFYYPYSLKEESAAASEKTTPAIRARAPPSTATDATSTSAEASVAPAPSQTTHAGTRTRDSQGDELGSSSRIVRLVSRSTRPPQMQNPSPPESFQAVPSAASSMDGYESFENTNNKKKRKIPTAGDIPHSGSYTSTDLHSATSAGSFSTNTNDDSLGGSPSSTTYSGPASFVSGSPGIGGPGRGRYGRSRSARAPIHAVPDPGSWAGRYGKSRPPWTVQAYESEPVVSVGTHSAANTEYHQPRGQGNMERRPSHQSAASTPAPTEFTFTCTSQVPGNLMWPGSDPMSSPGPAGYWGPGRLRGGQGPDVSTIPHMDGGRRGGSTVSSGGSRSPRDADGRRAKLQGRKKKGRNKLSQELDRQARERKRLQQEQNALNPSEENIYMCPFCEFERICGYKPRFLIRSFETKERKKRLEAERRQRLLDKAKARARKGRKPSRTGPAPAKNGSQTDSLTHEDASIGGGGGGGGGGDGGEEDDDAYEDDDGIDEGVDFVFRNRNANGASAGYGGGLEGARVSVGDAIPSPDPIKLEGMLRR